jgi:hypothetical protein
MAPGKGKDKDVPKVVIGTFSPAYMGVDTGSKGADVGDVKVKTRVGTAANGDPVYAMIVPPIQSRSFAELREHSNFDHLGIFLTGEEPKVTPDKPLSFKPHYTDASMHVSNQWVNSWPTLRRQGWGGWFIYAGYTNSESKHNKKPDHFNAAMAKEHGRLHAQHIKTILFNLSIARDEDNSGATVFMDCEGHELDDNLIIYYHEVFRELRKPGPAQCQPARPGLYTRNVEEAPNSLEMIDRNPDLFIWEIQFHRNLLQKDNKGNGLPIPIEKDEMVLLDVKKCTIEARQRKNVKSRRMVANAPVGVQAIINYGPIPKDQLVGSPARIQAVKNEYEAVYGQLNWWRGMPTKTIGKYLEPYSPWDFDLSFVRDARYPHANPRIAAFSTTVMQGDYVKNENRMRVLTGAKETSTAMEGSQLQPEAALILANERTFLTLDVRGELVVSTRGLGQRSMWEVIVPLLSQPPAIPLRRARGIAGSVGKWLHVAYIARDLSLQVVYRPEVTKPAIGPVALLEAPQQPVKAHAFSNIAMTSRDASGEVFVTYTISASGQLMATTFRVQPKLGPPLVQVDLLDKGSDTDNLDENDDPRLAPTLLQGTALAAISPTPNFSLVFGVSRKLTLYFWSARFLQAWQGPVGQRQNPWRGPHRTIDYPIFRLFPHTRLAVRAYTPNVIIVAAISYQVKPVLLTLVYDVNTGEWNPPIAGSPMRELPRERNKRSKTKLQDGEADASEWGINPYGDLAFGLDPLGSGNTVLMCAGIGPPVQGGFQSRVGILYRRVDIQYGDEDWYLII